VQAWKSDVKLTSSSSSSCFTVLVIYYLLFILFIVLRLSLWRIKIYIFKFTKTASQRCLNICLVRMFQRQISFLLQYYYRISIPNLTLYSLFKIIQPVVEQLITLAADM